jgi:hypothetical protein
LVTVAGPIISIGVVITGNAFAAPPWLVVMPYVQPPASTRVSEVGVELARFTAATKAFSPHATGIVMACAAGASAIRPPAAMMAPNKAWTRVQIRRMTTSFLETLGIYPLGAARRQGKYPRKDFARDLLPQLFAGRSCIQVQGYILQPSPCAQVIGTSVRHMAVSAEYCEYCP